MPAPAPEAWGVPVSELTSLAVVLGLFVYLVSRYLPAREREAQEHVERLQSHFREELRLQREHAGQRHAELLAAMRELRDSIRGTPWDGTDRRATSTRPAGKR